jgi:DNA (cytosine-5)-methyltransferase 1
VTQAPTFVDCFAGAGGLSLGLHLAGLRRLYAFDSDRLACETHALNLSGAVECTTIERLDPAALRAEYGAPDVVVGGPPCQGFSTQRRGETHDRRNDLVERFWTLALDLSPAVIVMENVPGVLGARGRDHMRRILAHVDSRSYDVAHSVVEVSRLGVPQRRRRALVVAWDPLRVKPFDFSPLLLPGVVRTVRDAIADLPPPPADFGPHPDVANHARVRTSALNVERISHVPEGGGRLDVPAGLRLRCHRDSTHRHLDVYGRLRWDEPSGTITAMFDNFTRGRFAHPAEDRNITNREGARLQSFPDSFVFVGPKKDVARQIGNAVPPLLGRAVGEQVLRQFAG